MSAPAPLVCITNAPSPLETTISLSGTVDKPTQSGMLGLKQSLEGMKKVSILVKLEYNAYERLDEPMLQTAVNALAAEFERRILPHCKTVEQLRLCIEFKCDGRHGFARYPCPAFTDLRLEDVPRTLTALRVGLTNKRFTRLLPGNLEVRIIGDHFPEWQAIW
ncbi:hypothetical protein K466DRAFT_597346 [Polyporus arcularius HHB13444]|uniref:Uncharacterized protein n=1 Tax=Polyporus arcularius HHB13444 TaxID=1314778 RepID=A0A5C3PNR2_9APHY|nr:hypothetical protein K466DRAFT_597346 [Polyporus arcularius HHB13444]